MFRNTKHTKSFIISALVLLLCMTCLIGETLALFTSDPEKGTIGVITTAGNLKVDIIDSFHPDKPSLVGEYLQFRTTTPQDEILFEPGASYFTQGFQVKNQGNVPINFRLYLSEDSSVDMEEFEKAFDVFLCTDPLNPDSAEPLKSVTGEMLKPLDCSTTYYLFIRMKDTADNTFQNKTYDGIGIVVYAVQANVGLEEVS